jgi:hypothetical protein
VRTRVCSDTRNCGTVLNKPAEAEFCNRLPFVEHVPQSTELKVYELRVLDFGVSAIDQDSDTISVTWILDGVVTKTDSMKGVIGSSYSIVSGRNVTAIISDGYSNQTVSWSISTSAARRDCTESWKCDWTGCMGDGMKYAQNCVDENGCDTTVQKPVRMPCRCVPEWTCPGGNCTGCWWCSDGIKDFDEQSIDCGGNFCPACAAPIPFGWLEMLYLLIILILIVIILLLLYYYRTIGSKSIDKK